MHLGNLSNPNKKIENQGESMTFFYEARTPKLVAKTTKICAFFMKKNDYLGGLGRPWVFLAPGPEPGRPKGVKTSNQVEMIFYVHVEAFGINCVKI